MLSIIIITILAITASAALLAGVFVTMVKSLIEDAQTNTNNYTTSTNNNKQRVRWVNRELIVGMLPEFTYCQNNNHDDNINGFNNDDGDGSGEDVTNNNHVAENNKEEEEPPNQGQTNHNEGQESTISNNVKVHDDDQTQLNHHQQQEQPLIHSINTPNNEQQCQKQNNNQTYNIKYQKYNTTTCAICITNYQNNDVIKCLLPCHHNFHKCCISEWLLDCNQSYCPLCRRGVCLLTFADGEKNSSNSGGNANNAENNSGGAIGIGNANSVNGGDFLVNGGGESPQQQRQQQHNNNDGKTLMEWTYLTAKVLLCLSIACLPFTLKV